ncbi:MAG: ABC transporter ATP-binding protein [Reyranellaceae bacterium]
MTLDSAALPLLVRGARIAFGDRVVADDLTLEFPAGRTTCLLGRSGVGKTSLLRWLAGLLPGAAPSRDVAYMAQTDLLLPWLSVLDNVLLGYRLRGDAPAIKAARPRAIALLEQVGLLDRLADLPQALSGGMRQRAALARTLCEDRAVVLMDEPFAHLDAVTRLELQDLAARLLGGRTVVLVTHDPLEALRLGHQVRVLSGRPLTAGLPIEPKGPVPRDPGSPELLGLHADLLAELREHTT